jgi:hypothetical protein
MPVWMQGSPLLFVFALAPLAIMAFWLVRTAVSRAAPISAASAA